MTRLLAAALRRAFTAGAAAERERIRQLALARSATYRAPGMPPDPAGRPFAELIGKETSRGL